jgi:arylsulfatase
VKRFRIPALLALLAMVLPLGATDAQRTTRTPARAAPPNIIVFLVDDLGWQDTQVPLSGTPTAFNARYRTPHALSMAAEGMTFTSFYVAQAVCSASRAALMTGCYANRVGMQGALNHTSKEGIHPDELLLPEMCKTVGYATGAFGKWHLGTYPMFNPLRHGFDEFLGIPYSNDNTKFHPSLA